MKKRISVAIVVLVMVVVGSAAVSLGGTKQDSSDVAGMHGHEQATVSKGGRKLAAQLAEARLATAKYATDLEAAKADGYTIITPMMPDMGFHFLNPTIAEFDVTKPPILVYVRSADSWQLVAFEWVFTEKPAERPLKGARYGEFGAACHYADGTFVFADSEEDCPDSAPETGATFSFWHPDLITLHVWLWYPNPEGLYHGTNPFIRPFNEE